MEKERKEGSPTRKREHESADTEKEREKRSPTHKREHESGDMEKEREKGSPTHKREHESGDMEEEREKGSPTRKRAAEQGNASAEDGSGASTGKKAVVPERESNGEALPEDLICLILSKLPPCATEHASFTCLNQRWNAAVKSLLKKLPPPLPSIILPSSCTPLFHSTVACLWCQDHGSESLDADTDCGWRRLFLPEEVQVHGRFCGSSEGGWFVLLLDEPHRHRLFNIYTRVMMDLPVRILISEEVKVFTVQAAVVSSSPLLPGYMVVAIGLIGEVDEYSSSHLAVRRYGSELWEHIHYPAVSDEVLVDLTYFKGDFWVLTSREKVGKVVFDQDSRGRPRAHCHDYIVRQRESYAFDTDAEEMKRVTTKRYLIVSEDDLYMVQKLIANNYVIEVRVFLLQLNDEEEESDRSDFEERQAEMYYTWENASMLLPDRIFFIGQGSSRSFRTSSPAKIYFIDDECREDAEDPGHFMRDEMGFIPIAEDMEYDVPERWPELGPPPLPGISSDRCPSAWWIH